MSAISNQVIVLISHPKLRAHFRRLWKRFPLGTGHLQSLCIPLNVRLNYPGDHYCDVIMTAIESQITSLTIVYSSVYSGSDERKHQSSASLAFVREIHRWPVNSPHKGSVTRKMFPFDDVVMIIQPLTEWCYGLHICVNWEKLHRIKFYSSVDYPVTGGFPKKDP